jgi:hypothetical protein
MIGCVGGILSNSVRPCFSAHSWWISALKVSLDRYWIKRVIKTTLTWPFSPVKPLAKRDINTAAGNILIHIGVKYNMPLLDGRFNLNIAINAHQPSSCLYIVRNILITVQGYVEILQPLQLLRESQERKFAQLKVFENGKKRSF